MLESELLAALSQRRSSTSTDKLIAIAIALRSLPWDQVKYFKLDWQNNKEIGYEPVYLPTLTIKLRSPSIIHRILTHLGVPEWKPKNSNNSTNT